MRWRPGQAGELDPETERAIRRWKLGHHLFHLYLVTMNSGMHRARASLRVAEWGALESEIADLAVLYDAATAAMKYAAGFRPETYERIIRPSMSPPMLSPGFSGQLNRDHEMTLLLLRSLKADFRKVRAEGKLPESLLSAWRRLMSAQSRNRREHVLICSKFVPDGTSLLNRYFADNPV
ncbi:hypothetical protein [Couchioplanes azureus]|uniref:hypothetical protein n=1 Tax=Couchioplanes caeruleus TaxID=56438 RepID=UPI00167006FC|nr:hypothetical protein [Couchioplanes caeruleus]GGQ67957.1 hypothetical protein GCM10010166_42440 [Couchioplanes caeruleus subsp. azureus]